MNIEVLREEYVGDSGVRYIFEYQDCDDFSVLQKKMCRQVRAVCFLEDKIVIGLNGRKGTWGIIGGTIEENETFEETLIREIVEESNMKILGYLPIGYQKVTDSRDGSEFYQLRYVTRVTPIGPFISDPAGTIVEIAIIDPSEYKRYFDWKKIGDRIIERALELKEATILNAHLPKSATLDNVGQV